MKFSNPVGEGGWCRRAHTHTMAVAVPVGSMQGATGSGRWLRAEIASGLAADRRRVVHDERVDAAGKKKAF